MKFGMNPGPYYRSKRSTTQIMLELLAGLSVIWLCAIVYYFISGAGNGLRAIFNPIVAMVVAMATEALFMLPKHIKEKGNIKSLLNKLVNSYGYITGLILALLLPVATSWYAIIISTVFAIAVGKMLFGGFGHNIFNPAILGRIFCQTAFLSKMAYDTEISTGATITSTMGNYGWSLEVIGSGQTSLIDVLLGNYRGALGETFTLIILIVGIVLMLRRVIDWRAPVFYIGTIFVSTFFMGLTGGYGLASFEYALVQISIGGIMFGAIFCITDPVTTPTSPAGRITYAMGAAIFTMLIRFLGSAPEGVAYSILLMNALTPLIDSSVKGLSNQFTRRKIITTCVMGAIAIGTGCISGTDIDKVEYMNYKNGYSTDSTRLVSKVKYLSKNENGTETYNVVVSGNLGTNFSKSYGKVTKLFKDELAEATSSLGKVTYTSEKNALLANYEENGKTVSKKVLTLSTAKASEQNADESKNWIIKSNLGDKTIDTKYTTNDYTAVYSVTIDEDLNIVVTFVSDHAASDETKVSYSSVDFDITVDYDKQVVVGTKFNSTGAGGGVGDAMVDGSLDFTIGDYTITAENSVLAANFYHKYIEVSTPVPFSEYEKYSNNTFKISEVDSAIQVGATYTANGYMYAMNSVIDYVNAYHKAQTAGKVGM